MTVPIVAVIAINKKRNIASLIEAKNSTSSRENSSHPTPGAGLRGGSCSVSVSGPAFIRVVLPVPPQTYTLTAPEHGRLGEGRSCAGRRFLYLDSTWS